MADRQDVSHILPLDSQPDEAIEHLLDAAFGTDRHGRTAYRIRQGMPWLPALSFAVVDDAGALIGSLQSWPVALTQADGCQIPLIMVGPVAVAPAHQQGGHGRAMMDAVIAAAREQRTEPLMMIGDPEYYGRFWGFTDEGTSGWDAPGPFEKRRLLALSVDGRPVGGVGILAPRIAVAA
ncbi:N-acetyltransferase [Sphingobium sp. BYY-5]|uniref:GNAT family N-acetyltransferase n=1 Tax=Sphingobium sp. BYY-5 TaxID=2926400 RepID=UPI001FA6C097|nr:N-acetyltransferase [Sphingobium sp. BYY-5]MCI4589659.1 N-acetyltransferase [Sphingobium sp. BYY-5]